MSAEYEWRCNVFPLDQYGENILIDEVVFENSILVAHHIRPEQIVEPDPFIDTDHESAVIQRLIEDGTIIWGSRCDSA